LSRSNKKEKLLQSEKNELAIKRISLSKIFIRALPIVSYVKKIDMFFDVPKRISAASHQVGLFSPDLDPLNIGAILIQA
jgi:hypothetical protein